MCSSRSEEIKVRLAPAEMIGQLVELANPVDDP